MLNKQLLSKVLILKRMCIFIPTLFYCIINIFFIQLIVVLYHRSVELLMASRQYHALQLQQQQQSAFPFTPSSSEVSTPSSPTNAFSSFHGPGGSPKLKTPGSNLSSSYASSGMEFEPTSPSNFRKSIGNVAGSNSSNTLFSSSADYSTMQHQSKQVIFFLFE